MGKLFDQTRKGLLIETIEHEMCHDEIVSLPLENALIYVLVNEVDPGELGACLSQPEHCAACLDTIHRGMRMQLNELGKKAAVPFPDDEDAIWRFHLAEESETSFLQLIPKNKRLEQTIDPRDAIKAHRQEKRSASSGVRRTRSASAVR